MENSAQIEIQVGRGTIEEGREIYIDKPILLDIEIKKEEEEVQVGLEKGQIQQPIKKIMHRKRGQGQDYNYQGCGKHFYRKNHLKKHILICCCGLGLEESLI